MTATPGATKRLGTAGNSEDSQVLAPKGTHKADAQTAVSQSRFGTDPANTITPSGDFNAGAMTMDLRGGSEVITLSSFGGTDSFTITLQEADGTKVTTAAIVRGTNAAASDVQTAIRNALTGTDLTTVSGTTDAGPYTVVYNRFYQGRRFPKIIAITGTGCTGAVTRARTPSDRLGGGVIGESLFDGDGVGPGHALDAPVIGTITPTDATHEVQTLDFPAFSAGGGAFELAFRRAKSGQIAYNASVATVQAAIDAMFTQLDDKLSNVSGTDSPVVTKRGTNEVQTLTLTSFDAGDTIKLTHAGVESAAVTASAVAGTTLADFQAKADALFALTIPGYVAGACVVTQTTLNVAYVFTFSGQSVVGDVSAITATSGTGSASGVFAETTKGVLDGFVFTFSRGFFHGKPVRGGFRLTDSTITDGEVTITVTTAGVLGSASAAYTELATYGDSVLAVAINDTTGVEYGSGTGGVAVLDAATPVVISGLPPGTYTLVARTYNTASQRLGPASTKAFTIS